MANVERTDLDIIGTMVLQDLARNIGAWSRILDKQNALESTEDYCWENIQAIDKNCELREAASAEIESTIIFAREFGITSFEIAKTCLENVSEERRVHYLEIILKEYDLTPEERIALSSITSPVSSPGRKT